MSIPSLLRQPAGYKSQRPRLPPQGWSCSDMMLLTQLRPPRHSLQHQQTLRTSQHLHRASVPQAMLTLTGPQ